MKKIFFIIILIATMLHCRTKEHLIVNTNRVSNDSIYLAEISRLKKLKSTIQIDTVTIVEKQLIDFVFDNPCDSITGELRDFRIKSNNLLIEAKNGKLTAIGQCDSTVNVYQKIITKLEITRDSLLDLRQKSEIKIGVNKSKIVTRNVYPFWMFVIIFILILLIILLLKYK